MVTCHLYRPALGPTQPPVQWVSGLSWGVMLTLHPHLQCRGLKLGRDIPLRALRALVARKGGTFTIYFIPHCNQSYICISYVNGSVCNDCISTLSLNEGQSLQFHFGYATGF